VSKELPAEDPHAEQNLREFLRQLRNHLKQKGWLSRYVSTFTMNHMEQKCLLPALRAFVSEELPGVPTLDAISLHEDISDQEETTIWVPKLSTFDDRLDAIAAHKSRGGQCWYYICLDPRGKYVNRFIDFHRLRCGSCPGSTIGTGLRVTYTGAEISGRIGRSRMCNLIGAEGSFCPRVTTLSFTPDPKHEGVFVSVRLEVMREGIEDYELLMEAARHQSQRADALAPSGDAGFTDYVRDVTEFRKFDHELLVLATEAQRE